MDCTMRKWFIRIGGMVCLLLSMVINVQAQGKTYVLAIGISDYPDKKDRLVLAAQDADTIQWVFRKNGQGETRLLKNKQATCKNIRNTMAQLFGKAKKDDAVLLFFSGHGTPGGFCAYDDNLEYLTIIQLLNQCKATRKMIFADACFSGKMRAMTKGMQESVKSSNVLLFLSSRHNEMSMEDERMNNGYFTTYLQLGLRGKADKNRDRIITAKELFNFVSEAVKRRTYNKQHPVMWGDFPDDMAIIKWERRRR